MKKLITIALLAAMLLSCFAGCAMQKGEIDVEAYAGEAGAQNVEFRTELDDDADKSWEGIVKKDMNGDGDTKDTIDSYGNADFSWYTGDKTEYEISTAAQLRGVQYLLVAKTTQFEGVTVKLTKDLDLNGKDWASPASTLYFLGTFDGQGHVISNWKQSVTGAGYQSFLFSIGGNACVKNLSLVNATFTIAATAVKNNFGTLITRVKTQNGKTATISNVYTEVDFVVKSGAVRFDAVGSIASYVEGDGGLVIENCQNNNTIAGNGRYNGGIISQLAKAEKVTINNCSMTGSIDVTLVPDYTDGSTGGIVGTVGTVSDTLNIQNCTVSGDVKADGYKVGGVVGYTGTCKKGLVVDNCVVSGKIEATTMSAGLLGYVDKAMDIAISNCKVTGSFTGHRTSGGLIGTLNSKGKVVDINNCEVTASLNLILDDTKNNNGGGLIGKLDNATNVMIRDCSVNSIMKATYAPLEPKTKVDTDTGATVQDGDIISGAAGLIGRVNAGSKACISNTSVAGNFEFIYAGDDYASVEGDPLTFITGRFVGSISENSEVHYRENNSVDSALTIKYTGNEADFVVDGEGSVPSILPVGYQVRDNGDGTYDLRYVIAAKDMFDGLGVKANIRYVDENGVFDEKNQKIYVDTVYPFLLGMDENDDYFYAAEEYYYDYLYTLVVKGVPAEYNFDAGNLQVILKPFGATNEGGVVTETEMSFVSQGDHLSNSSAKDMGIDIDNFSATLEDKFVADGVIYIPGESYDAAVSIGVNSTAANKNECTGGYQDGTLSIPRHYYLDTGVTSAGLELVNITYNFRVTESGWYDMCIDMRMKGAGTDGNGANQRNSLLLIDWAGGEQAYDISFELENVTDIKTDSAGSYMTGVKVYLEAGEHTISFTSNEGFTGNNFHIRNIYLAKAD